MNGELTEKQKLFCDEYLIDFNGKQAAIRAKYSPDTAENQASRLLSYDKVQAYLQAKKEKIAKKVEHSAERTLQEISRLAYQDVRKFYREDGSLIPIKELDDDAAAVIAGFDLEETFERDAEGKIIPKSRIKKIKRFGKDKALEMLAKHYKLYSDATVINNNLPPMSNEQVDRIIEELRKKK